MNQNNFLFNIFYGIADSQDLLKVLKTHRHKRNSQNDSRPHNLFNCTTVDTYWSWTTSFVLRIATNGKKTQLFGFEDTPA